MINTWVGDDDVRAVFDKKVCNHWEHLETSTNNNI